MSNVKEAKPTHDFSVDIEAVQSISIVPTILDVICQTTGMGFAAVARVTEDRWIACSVKDKIEFGLKPGGELEIKTTICNEIRDSGKAVVIDEVASDPDFRQHHTPTMYGFQSYISVPIVLRTGEFFGTLCAIDPSPAHLKNEKITGMFTAFAELIALHLQNLDFVRQSHTAVSQLKDRLSVNLSDSKQFNHVSNHSLQEPLRKMRMFSSMLLDSIDENKLKKSKDLATKLNSYATRLSSMINGLAEFTELSTSEANRTVVDMNKVVAEVIRELEILTLEKDAMIDVGELPAVNAVPSQLYLLFYHLIENSLKFSRQGVPPRITIQSNKTKDNSIEIIFADNGRGMEAAELEKIFDFFSSAESSDKSIGMGLAYCRKIVQNHHGSISATSLIDQGTTMTIILPG